MVSTMNIARRPSWLRVAGVSLAILFTVLAVLWFRVSVGADPVLQRTDLVRAGHDDDAVDDDDILVVVVERHPVTSAS